MKIKIKSSIFKKFINFTSKVLQEANLQITKENIHVVGIDDGRIACLDIYIDKEDFEIMQFPEKEIIKFGINFEFLEKMLKDYTGDIEVSFNDRERRVRIQGKTLYNSVKGFSPMSEELPMDNLYKIKYECSVTISLPSFIKKLKSINLSSETVSISSEKEKGIEFYSFAGEETDPELETRWIPEWIEDFKFVGNEKIVEAFANEYLKNFKGAKGFNQKMRIFINGKSPLRVDLTFGKKSRAFYFLANRVEEEEEEEYDEDN